MLDAMKCRMEKKIEGNCYSIRTRGGDGRKREKNSNENYFFHANGDAWVVRKTGRKENKSRLKTHENSISIGKKEVFMQLNEMQKIIVNVSSLIPKLIISN